MKKFKLICISTFSIFIILAVALNIYLLKNNRYNDGKYRVEVKRLADEIREKGSYDLANYHYITGVFSGGDINSGDINNGDIFNSDEPYVIIDVDGTLYRVEYVIPFKGESIIILNCIIVFMLILICGVFIYIWRNIIKPLGKMYNVPLELSKGNLAVSIPEHKNRFLGDFIWGVNLLREKIEADRLKELSMQRDKKMLLLSLSHDVKTPLSAIKLNAKALSKGIYKDEDKCREVADSINARADEIEKYVSEITKASSEDFMNFEIKKDDAFLSQIINKIQERYALQLSNLGTEFIINQYDDCLLSCDINRLAECLQNLIENAIKYGDGSRIEIDFEKIDGCELIKVTNTGCFLEAKELPQIFSSFYRGENSNKTNGNGLGLFICKKLMTLMGGEVYAEIKDNCFCVTLVVKLA